MTDYNDGKWHGWNGGECPVHPESAVEVVFSKAGYCDGCEAGAWEWGTGQGTHTIVAFRVVTPYAEPVEYSGECCAWQEGGDIPAFLGFKASYTTAGRYTATHINGKLARIVWEATE